MSRRSKSKLVIFGSSAWFDRVGKTSMAIGEPNFHDCLVGLLGCLIEHDSAWVIRFSGDTLPEVMYTRSIPQSLRDYYDSSCSDADPFAAHWRLHREVGVRTLLGFKGMLDAIDTRQYDTIFKPVAKVSDELGVFLPIVGNSSIGFFLEREVGEFSCEEIDRATAAFPILNSLERAHVGRVFEQMRRNGSLLGTAQFNSRPTLVQDRCGVEIYSSLSWSAAAAREPDLNAAVLEAKYDCPLLLDHFVLTIEHFDKYFPLAPGGRMLTLTRCPDAPDERETTRARTELLRCLTPRERDVFRMTLEGRPTSEISRLLSISKGTIKNYTLRIYKKSQVNSRRILIQKYSSRSKVMPIC